MDTTDQSEPASDAKAETSEQTATAKCIDAVLISEFCGIQPGTAIKIAPADASGFSAVTTEGGQEFEFASAEDDSEGLRIRAMGGQEFTVNHKTLPVVPGKKCVIPRLDPTTDMPAHIRQELHVGHTIILEEPTDGQNAITATTMQGIQFMVTREIAALLSRQAA